MSSRTPNQEEALAWFCKENDFNPQLSAHPVYYFTTKTGKTVEHNINTITAKWLNNRKEERKMNTRNRRGGK